MHIQSSSKSSSPSETSELKLWVVTVSSSSIVGLVDENSSSLESFCDRWRLKRPPQRSCRKKCTFSLPLPRRFRFEPVFTFSDASKPSRLLNGAIKREGRRRRFGCKGTRTGRDAPRRAWESSLFFGRARFESCRSEYAVFMRSSLDSRRVGLDKGFRGGVRERRCAMNVNS